MKKRRYVNVTLTSPTESVVARGIRVKVGCIDDLFAATPYWKRSGGFIDGLWNITHIPSGFACLTYSESPEEAVAAFEKKLKEVGKKSYVKAIEKAMAWRMDTGTEVAMRKA